MNLKTASKNVLNQLLDVLLQIQQKDYHFRASSLEASIGQHVRHILEFYICLIDGVPSGKINYDRRNRDKRIETDKHFAIDLIGEIKSEIEQQDGGFELILELQYGDISDHHLSLKTNYERELAYNIEHTIHHLAIMKQAFLEICPYIKLPDNFGIASSTVRYMNEG